MASVACPILILFLLLLSTTTISTAHNITAILSTNPAYTEYSDLLIKTKLANEINSRQTITVLVLNDTVINSSNLKSKPLETLKTLLSIHVLLDYFDSTKLHNIPDGSIISTSLYQTSGVAAQRNGFVNITDSKGKVFFSSATTGSKPTSLFTKSVKSEPYNISVIEISAPIDAPGVLNPQPTKDLNLTALLINAGCKRFADLINNEKVLQDYDGVRSKGLSVFAPSDDAWKVKKGMPDWTKISENDLKTVLRYHAAPNYFPIATLKGMKDEFITLATIGGDKYGIVPEASGDYVLLKTGVDSARAVNTIVDSAPVVVFLIDNVLLPVELFGKNSSATPPSGPPIPLPSSPTPHGPPPKPQPILSPPAPQPGAPTPASRPALTPASKGPSKAPPAPAGESPATSATEPAAADEEGTTKKSGGSCGNGGALSYRLFVALMIGVLSLML